MENLYTNYKDVWHSQNNSMDSLFNYIKGYEIEMDESRNITVKNTTLAENVPAFCCHLDTVHKAAPAPLYVRNVLFDSAGNGIGGDDKCGIVACLELLRQIPCKCIFFTEEEKGGVGSRAYDQDSLNDARFLIEIDRKGSGDLIFESGCETLCGKEFKDAITKHFVNYKKEKGVFTDVNVLNKTNLNMMNISCGYYLPHTNREYVLLDVLGRTIYLLKTFAENDTTFKPFKRRKTYPATTSLYERYDSPSYWGQNEKNTSAFK